MEWKYIEDELPKDHMIILAYFERGYYDIIHGCSDVEDGIVYWIQLPNNPECIKKEDSLYCCEIRLKLKHIFQDDRLLSDVKKYVNDLISDCEMRCSEHSVIKK